MVDANNKDDGNEYIMDSIDMKIAAWAFGLGLVVLGIAIAIYMLGYIQ